jgi:hypothetical protein
MLLDEFEDETEKLKVAWFAIWFWITAPFWMMLEIHRWNQLTPEAQIQEALAMMRLGTDLRIANERVDDLQKKLHAFAYSRESGS